MESHSQPSSLLAHLCPFSIAHHAITFIYHTYVLVYRVVCLSISGWQPLFHTHSANSDHCVTRTNCRISPTISARLLVSQGRDDIEGDEWWPFGFLNSHITFDRKSCVCWIIINTQNKGFSDGTLLRHHEKKLEWATINLKPRFITDCHLQLTLWPRAGDELS